MGGGISRPSEESNQHRETTVVEEIDYDKELEKAQASLEEQLSQEKEAWLDLYDKVVEWERDGEQEDLRQLTQD